MNLNDPYSGSQVEQYLKRTCAEISKNKLGIQRTRIFADSFYMIVFFLGPIGHFKYHFTNTSILYLQEQVNIKKIFYRIYLYGIQQPLGQTRSGSSSRISNDMAWQ